MSGSERHFTFRWKIESKRGGGFIAVSDDPSDTIEAETREEVEDKIRERLVAAMGPEFAAKIELAIPGTHATTHVDKKFSLAIRKPGQDAAQDVQSESATPAPIDAGGGSMLTALWKIAVLIGIAIVIWLLLQRR